ncbi:MAG: hypothetical protein PUC82_03325 [bacterium]|nr:hypothetical protein [bacterium]
MDKIKIKDFITAYSNALDLDDNIEEVIRELFLNMKKLFPVFPLH